MSPIFVLWAHPRSMSTAMERIMRERGDCFCMHEPFMYYFYVHLASKRMPFFETEPDRPTQFHEIISLMLEKAKEGPVFAKDMAYYVLPEITHHPRLAHQIKHIFLIRDPRKSLISYHRLDPGLQQKEVGIESLWQLHNWVTEQTGNAPLVIEAEKIQENPMRAMETVWRYMELPFLEHAFNWDKNKQPSDWQQVSTWHEKTQASESIQSEVLTEHSLQQEFQQLVVSAPQLQTYLDHHLPFYKKLLALAS